MSLQSANPSSFGRTRGRSRAPSSPTSPRLYAAQPSLASISSPNLVGSRPHLRTQLLGYYRLPQDDRDGSRIMSLPPDFDLDNPMYNIAQSSLHRNAPSLHHPARTEGQPAHVVLERARYADTPVHPWPRAALHSSASTQRTCASTHARPRHTLAAAADSAFATSLCIYPLKHLRRLRACLFRHGTLMAAPFCASALRQDVVTEDKSLSVAMDFRFFLMPLPFLIDTNHPTRMRRMDISLEDRSDDGLSYILRITCTRASIRSSNEDKAIIYRGHDHLPRTRRSRRAPAALSSSGSGSPQKRSTPLSPAKSRRSLQHRAAAAFFFQNGGRAGPRRALVGRRLGCDGAGWGLFDARGDGLFDTRRWPVRRWAARQGLRRD
ncbi:hypothetical protein PLICRDRAFT_178399 [Plicaturopsis crispa FD-325 SS-3]|nr:hypothetical protein PLICRDRAFT_178399 [Plicaturopsis crispa FD-325 SS-3]